ncbi:MAG: glycosyltransferase family 39 protein, partial [Armatimonadota bacterium]
MAAVVRMLISTGQELSFDEAYYWTWSQHLDYWYYDQGPMIAWIIRLFTLFGSSVVTVKLVAITCSSVFLYFGYRLVSELIDARTGLYWLAVIMSTPLFLLGGAISTYDAPMLMFWSAASYSGYRALMTGHFGYWLTAGFVSSLGVLSKLPTLALPVGIFLMCIASPDGRKKLITPYPWIAGVIALLPLILLKYWDDTNAHLFTLHSASLSKRHTDAAFGRWIGDLIAGQLLVLGPTTFIGFVWALLRHRSSENAQTRSYIFMMSVPLLMVCLL